MERRQRRCSYCDTPGHNRRTCSDLKEHEKIYSTMNGKYIRLIVEDMTSLGIAQGTLVEYVQAIQGREEVTAMGFITGFLWDELFFRKPSKRWIKIQIIGNPTVKHGSYAFSLSTPYGSRDRLWRIRFLHHELRREWCAENRLFKYVPSLKQISSGEYDDIASSQRIGGYWRVASPLQSTFSRLLKTPEDRKCLEGENNVKEWFETIGFHGGSRECKTVNLEEWK